jgi:hypothetical protein
MKKVAALVVLLGCNAGLDPNGQTPPGPAPQQPGMTGVPGMTPMGAPPVNPPSTIDWASITPKQADAYLRKLAPILVSRPLTVAERTQIVMLGGKAIEPTLTAWLADPAFVEEGRRFIEEMLSVSGKLGDIDFGLPGYLAAYLVKNNRPWSEIITSPTCYDSNLKPIKCDSGAPYGAGVFTTRAILLSRTGRFNLTRASTITRGFACRAYPLDDSLQQRVEKSWLLPMFQALTPEEQVDDRAKNGFGNGTGCYTCHGQFSLHAQLFVKFDAAGLYHPEANGLQDPSPMAELGRSSQQGLMASHFKDAENAKKEGVNIYGKPVANLAEAMKVLASMPMFTECAANKFMDHTLGVLAGQVKYDPYMFIEIGYRARQRNADPTLADIVYSLFTHPAVVRSMLGLGGAQ